VTQIGHFRSFVRGDSFKTGCSENRIHAKLTFRVTVTTVVDECGDWPIHGRQTPDGYLRCLRAVRSAGFEGRDAGKKL
jgi:hypothetical protein